MQATLLNLAHFSKCHSILFLQQSLRKIKEIEAVLNAWHCRAWNIWAQLFILLAHCFYHLHAKLYCINHADYQSQCSRRRKDPLRFGGSVVFSLVLQQWLSGRYVGKEVGKSHCPFPSQSAQKAARVALSFQHQHTVVPIRNKRNGHPTAFSSAGERKLLSRSCFVRGHNNYCCNCYAQG